MTATKVRLWLQPPLSHHNTDDKGTAKQPLQQRQYFFTAATSTSALAKSTTVSLSSACACSQLSATCSLRLRGSFSLQRQAACVYWTSFNLHDGDGADRAAASSIGFGNSDSADDTRSDFDAVLGSAARLCSVAFLSDMALLASSAAADP